MSGVPHRAARNLARDLMYVTPEGVVETLTTDSARRLIAFHGSIRSAARAINVPKSTLHDLVHDVGKSGGRA